MVGREDARLLLENPRTLDAEYSGKRRVTSGFDGNHDLFEPGHVAPEATRPEPALLMIIRGRGRVGKTVVANSIGQFFRAAGAHLEIWSLDPQDRPDSLCHFFDDVRFPGKLQPLDCQRWLEAMIQEQRAQRYNVLLDIASAYDFIIMKLRRDADFTATLETDGIRPVGIFPVGTDLGDLDHLRRHLEERLMPAEAILVVLNQGIVGQGSLRGAFEAVKADPVIRIAESHGAVVAEMPELGCMRDVVKRRLTFQVAANDRRLVRMDDPLSFFDQERVGIWWEKSLPRFFRTIPASWMPRIAPAAEAS
jgi:hypothetical protein